MKTVPNLTSSRLVRGVDGVCVSWYSMSDALKVSWGSWNVGRRGGGGGVVTGQWLWWECALFGAKNG